MSRSTGSLHPRHPKGLTNLEWFQPELLKHLDHEGVDVALESVQRFVRPDTLSFVLGVALGLRGCTELLLSCEQTNFSGATVLTVPARRPLLALSHDRFSLVLNWVDDVFPHSLDDYSPKAVCPTLLSTISVSLLFLQSPNQDDLPRDLDASHQYVVLSNSVLQALVTIIQSFEFDGGPSDEEAFPLTKRKKASQKAQKSARKGRQMTRPVDLTPFRALHLEVPTSHGEAKEVALGILSKQKSILMVVSPSPTPDPLADPFFFQSHLRLFRLVSLYQILKRNYIPPVIVDVAVEDNGILANRSDKDIEILEEVPAAYPQVQPMKAALYFDSVEGFGQWRILISGRADRNLREMRKKDRNLFRITLKKIK